MEFKGTTQLLEVRHSLSKTAWNVVGTRLGHRYKIARFPYNDYKIGLEELTQREREEAYADAVLFSKSREMLEVLQDILEGSYSLPVGRIKQIQTLITSIVNAETP